MLLSLFVLLGCNSGGELSEALDPGLTTNASSSGNSGGSSSGDTGSGTTASDVGAGGATLTKTGGDAQNLSYGMSTPTPMKVLALNSLNVPITGETITWTVSSGGGAVTSTTSTTDSNGLAEMTYTAGSSAGDAIIVASSRQGTVTFSHTIVNVNYSAYSVAKFSGDSQSAIINSALSNPLVVRVLDGSSLPAANVPIVFEVTSASSTSGRFSGNIQTQVLSDANGYASASFTVGPRSSVTNMVNAYAAGYAAVNIGGDFSLTATDNFSIGAGGQSTVNAAATTLEAIGTTTTLVTLQLKDSLGANDTTAYGQAVTFAASTGSMIGSTTDNSDGSYTQVFRAPSTTGAPAIIQAYVNGSLVQSDTATISLTPGSLDAAASTITLGSRLITTGGTTPITIQLTDVVGNNMTSSQGTVSCSMSGAGSVGAVSDNANGTYSATLTAAGSAGADTLTCTIGGQTISGSGVGVFYSATIGAPDATQSTLTLASSLAPAGERGGGSVLATVQLRDSTPTNYPVGGSSVTITSTLGVVSAVTDNGDGTYSATITPPTAPAVGGTVEARLSGALIGSTQAIGFYGNANVANSTLTPASATPNTGATNVVTFTARDSIGTAIPVGGETITIAADAGSFVEVNATDNSDGTYTRTHILSAVTTPCAANQTVNLSSTIGGSAGPGSSANVTNTVDNFPANATAITCADIATYLNKNLCILAGRTVSLTTFYGTASTGGSAQCAFTVTNLIVEGTLDHTAQGSISPVTLESDYDGLELEATASIEVRAGGTISGVGKGMHGGYSTTNNGCVPGICNSSAGYFGEGVYPGYRSGGSHGGVGGNTSIVYAPTFPFGDATNPRTPGGGGGMYSTGGTNAQRGMRGGGVIRLKAANISVAGTISANGEERVGVGGTIGGAGAGGSIRLETTGTGASAMVISGTAVVSANGGDVTGAGYGGGGGGRIAIIGDDTGVDWSRITVNSGQTITTDTPLHNPEGGTLYRGAGCISGALTINSDLTIDENDTEGTTNIACSTTDLTMNGKRLNLTSQQVSGFVASAVSSFELSSLSLVNGAVMTTNRPTSTRSNHIDLNVSGAFTLDATSKVDLQGRGYYATKQFENYVATTGQLTTYHVGPGGVIDTSISIYSGGSHGGVGAYYTSTNITAAFGTRTAPDTWGSSSGTNISSGPRIGGSGGGLLKLTAGSAVINGVINADGYRSCYSTNSTGAGAGGGINISITGNLTGSGSITAVGGGADLGMSSCAASYCGGGGGRIALNVSGTDNSSVSTSDRGGTQATGNFAYCTEKGAQSGTTYRPNPSATNAPAQIDGLQTWLDSQDVSTLFQTSDCTTTAVAANGDAVNCWRDKSGNNNHHVFYTGMGSPEYDTGTLTEAGVLFTRAQNDMLCLSSDTATNDEVTMIVVAKPNSFPAGNGMSMAIQYDLGGSWPSGGFHHFYQIGAGDNELRTYMQDRSGAPGAVSTNAITTVSKISYGRAGLRFSDTNHVGNTADRGEVSAVSTNANNGTGRQCVGGHPQAGFASYRFDGVIQEVLIYNRLLSNDELNIIGNYLEAKYTEPSWTDFSSISP